IDVDQDVLKISSKKMKTIEVGPCSAIILFLTIKNVNYAACYHCSLTETTQFEFKTILTKSFKNFFDLIRNKVFDTEELSSLVPPDCLLNDINVDSIIILGGAHDEPNFKEFIRSFYSSFSHGTFNVRRKEMPSLYV
ncbi:unnamed protein product, partial [Didymodactylos carnosus]